MIMMMMMMMAQAEIREHRWVLDVDPLSKICIAGLSPKSQNNK